MKSKFNFLFALIGCLFLASCMFIENNDGDSFFVNVPNEHKEQFIELLNLLRQEENGSENEFAVTREIAVSFARLGEYNRLIHFLNERIINNPTDPYNAYYLMLIAYAHLQLEAFPTAAMYFNLIIDNYPDLVINDVSIHFECLNQLINLTDNSERLVFYYRELISRFSDDIDLGTAYFMLGQHYERIGDWNGALTAYNYFLPYSGTVINGFPNADQYVRQLIDFSRSSKDWTFESLPALRRAIQSALDEGDPVRLQRYQARVNFFTRSWGQETDVTRTHRIVDFRLAAFMYGNRIHYSPNLDASSNATEAFLRTWGWSRPMEVWYLYFRKIHFPQDPEIHGRWEWAGIYYGEMF